MLSLSIKDIQYFCATVNKFENFNIDSFLKFSLFGENLDENSIDLKIALSFDENNYFIFKDENWNSINKDRTEIFNNGMTLEEFTSITKNDIKDYFGEVENVRITEVKTKKGKTYKAVPVLNSRKSENKEKEENKDEELPF